MATLLLQVAGTAVGTMFGGPLGAAIGSAIGGVAGGMIDRSLFAKGAKVEGPRLKSLDGISASEGAPIPRAYGRVRLGGQVIWATRFEEQVEVKKQGKSGGKSSGGAKTTTTTHSYFANVAVALCEGPIGMVRRIWADGKLLDLNNVNYRVYTGAEDQVADPLLVARQGDAPAYRGIAYVVFERLPLADYGNRLPQLSFEVLRPVTGPSQLIRGVDLIPGATEFGLQSDPVHRILGLGSSAAENRNQLQSGTDLDASLDTLAAVCPNAQSVAMVVSWFGDDLRVDACRIRPAVDSATKQTQGATWMVAGRDRASARLVTQIDGRAAYGGTPSDQSVVGCIGELRARGKSVVYYPFVMMDVAPGTALPDPWGGASQAPFPWRGRITCMPAAGQPGSPDGTAAAASAVAAFFGTAKASDFALSGTDIAYSGPDEWSYSRFLLHNAALAKAAGGVDAFIIGSEFVQLTRIRSSATGYAAPAYFKALAGEVRAMLGPTVKIGYAADWTEYGAHVRNGGTDVGFPLDDLWADPNIDFIGIDYYPPVADWRDGTNHLDAQQGYGGRDVAYLKDRLGAGEAFDWYYASDAHRAAQIRTPITDGAFGKPWTFRAKDLVGWWSNAHRPRVGGSEAAATAWVPQSKPIWLTEFGCPAVDKGPNSPNLFIDPKSSESGYPPFSSRARDDLVQARFIEAVMRRFDPALPGFVEAHNPVSTQYGGRMIDPARIHVWAWDARPFPAFPHVTSVWGDGPNWLTGHWLNGRAEGAPLDRLIAAIVQDYGLPSPSFGRVDGFVDGYVIDRPMSARGAMEPLTSLFGISTMVASGTVRFAGRGQAVSLAVTRDDLVPDKKGREIIRTRAQETELPRQITLGFSDGDQQYQPATAASRRLETNSRVEQASETTAVMIRPEAQRRVDQMLQDAWVGRETVEIALRPGLASLEPGDALSLPGEDATYSMTRVTDGLYRSIEARRVEPDIFDTPLAGASLQAWSQPKVPGPPLAEVIALAIDPADPTPLAYLALRADPWKGPYTVWRGNGTSFSAVATVERPTVIGETLAPFGAGPLWRWDRKNALQIRLAGGALASLDEIASLDAGNLLAIISADGLAEIISYCDAQLVSPGEWRLTRLLRGQYGSEPQAGRNLAAGARVMLLDGALTPLFLGASELGQQATFRVSAAGTDYADASSAQVVGSAASLALAPLSPVGARAMRNASGITITWVRRTRKGGDNWEQMEVPLAEASESYQLDILAAGIVKRSVTVASPSFDYTTAAELSDFGSQQTTLSLRIRQISSAAGPGLPLMVDVPIRAA